MQSHAEIWEQAGRAEVHGLMRCSSPWECADCAQRIGLERRAELEQLATAHRAGGGELYHCTLTVKHETPLPPKPLRKHVTRGWSYVISGEPWRRKVRELGLNGQVRALDVTVGPHHGWHPHLHVLLLSSAPLSDEQQLELTEWIYARWCRAIVRPVKGAPEIQLEAPTRKRGIRLERANVAGYLAEASICWPDELASPTMKEARGDNRTPWQVLHDITFKHYATEEAGRRDVGIWLEWGESMRGAKQLTWSKGLKKRYQIAEVSDEDAAQGELELADAPEKRHMIDVPAWEWNNLVLADPDLYAELLEIAEIPGIEPADAQRRADALLERARKRHRGPLRRTG